MQADGLMNGKTHVDTTAIPATFVGLTSTLVGIGLARLAYTPLIPAIVDAHWFSSSAAAYLGAANLFGYLFGALSAHRLSERYGVRTALVVSFTTIALSFVLCAHVAPFAWFFVWRLLSGLAGAWLMVIGPATALAFAPREHRSTVGTLTFLGIGIGVLISALVVPTLVHAGLGLAWRVLGGITLGASALSIGALLRLPLDCADTAETPSSRQLTRPAHCAVSLVIAAYACDGIGFVPHTVFWVDYLARECDLGLTAANAQWALFGLGALFGPIAIRFAVPRTGWRPSLIGGLGIKCVAVGLPLIGVGLWTRTASSILVGALVPGIVALTSGRLAELAGPAAYKRLWGYATAAFALTQAAAGYGMSGLYSRLGSYQPLFGIAATILAVGCALAWWAHPNHFQPRSGPEASQARQGSSQ